MDKGLIIPLTDEQGNTVEYELLDVVNLNDNTYAVFYPTIPDDTEVLILRVEDIPNSDEDNYIVETDEKTVQQVYKMFKEKYKGKILFPETII